MRALQVALFRSLALICGWYWFGASGVVLIGLWLVVEGRGDARLDPGANWSVFLESAELQCLYLGDCRLVLRAGSLGRLEVYRDELPAEDWARLRRRCLMAKGPAGHSRERQPATGRSTSSSSA